MKFNTKTRYGLRTMLELALNEDNVEGIFQKEIAQNQDVSLKYLDQIIASLKSAGLLVNVSGKKSGYKLNRPASDITIYDIYLAFEDELEIIGCLNPDSECTRKNQCVLRGFWCELNNSIIIKMKSMNIYVLANNHKNKIMLESKKIGT